MQSYHYEAFVVNYAVLVGLLITFTLFGKPIPSRLLLWIAALAFSWGLLEVGFPARLNYVPAAVVRDQIVPVLVRLKQLSTEDGTVAGLRANGKARTIVFSPQLVVTDLQPTWTSQGTLLDVGGLDFNSVSREERKGYFHMHLYYCKTELGALREVLNGKLDDPSMGYYARSAVFGHDRVVPALSANFKPIQPPEIEQEIRAYQTYANSFSRSEALKRPLNYAIVGDDGKFDFTNLDHWYERDTGEHIGAYTLYHLKLRD
jgi:hypothetical protein